MFSVRGEEGIGYGSERRVKGESDRIHSGRV